MAEGAAQRLSVSACSPAASGPVRGRWHDHHEAVICLATRRIRPLLEAVYQGDITEGTQSQRVRASGGGLWERRRSLGRRQPLQPGGNTQMRVPRNMGARRT